MHPELKKYIDLALVDGTISSKEREVILRKAKEYREDADAVEMELDALLFKMDKERGRERRQDRKCPNCKELLSGLSMVCPYCDFVITELDSGGTRSNELKTSLNRLGDLIVDVKSLPKPSFLQAFKIAAITMNPLLYFIFRKKNTGGDSFETLIAKCEKESRLIKLEYGEDKKIASALEELKNEVDKIVSDRRKRRLQVNIGCLGAIVLYVLITVIAWAFKGSSK